ncbi:PREDICTED: RNA 3'-terminal phosphate cyclase-like protein [Priapulus caudatus]|uniref:RNA 3'-terminal phosphate cyclase-like protein n=1 Tax=Priapulus caudatus TaxID=37621 RepID=A0ABM1DYJ3_PRICU|nr:PREDICTED: RNA 3'-terminal phosphate cyclase-like protein [Priapulus caudatus]
MLEYEGCNFIRQRLILSILSGKSVRISNIRYKDDNPGLRKFEASFIRLLDTLTNGSRVEINATGTRLFFQPGLLLGGTFEHDCNPERGIGYYLEALICLAPFTKKPIKATLKGVTNDQVDPSVDFIKATTLPLLKRFIVDDEGLELKVVRRGAPPGGGGEVTFSCPNKQKLRPLQLTDVGKVRRVRGVAYAARVSPAVANRCVDAARSVLNRFLPDVYIYTDHARGAASGKSPGFGVSLVAETTAGTFLGAEVSSHAAGLGLPPSVPEDLGREAAHALLEEIYSGGIVDSTNQGVALLLMALGQQDVSKMVVGALTPYTIEFLRHVRDFLHVTFKIEVQTKAEEDDDDGDALRMGAEKVMLTCVGAGFTNLSKTVL